MKTSRVAMIASGVAVVIGALVLLFAAAPSGEQPDAAPLVGRDAPNISAKDTAGAQFSLSAERGRWVLVNFFATWCGPCKVEQPELIRFARQQTDTATIVSISFNDSPEAVKKFFAEEGGDWAVIAEGNASIALDYGVVKLPESYLVNPKGKVVEKFAGGVTTEGVEAAMSRHGAKR